MLIKETNLNATYHHSTLFNNSKYNKNIISFFGLFIIGVLYYIIFGAVNILIRQGWITDLHGSMDLFVQSCIWPVVLPTIYFMRNPKHLKSVLQDHNLMQIDYFLLNKKKIKSKWPPKKEVIFQLCQFSIFFWQCEKCNILSEKSDLYLFHKMILDTIFCFFS